LVRSRVVSVRQKDLLQRFLAAYWLARPQLSRKPEAEADKM
jgi:hypothetical protein